MNLLQNEIKIGATKDEKIMLTNSRIIQEELKFGSNYHLSIHLEDISSIEMHYKANTKLLIAGIIITLYGLYSILTNPYNKTQGMVITLIGIILLLIWWFTRRFTVSIRSNGGTGLDCYFEATSTNTIDEFLNLLEQAKLDRVNKLHSISNILSGSTPFQNTVSTVSSYSTQCPSCKNTIKPDDIFCENCGHKLK